LRKVAEECPQSPTNSLQTIGVLEQNRQTIFPLGEGGNGELQKSEGTNKGEQQADHHGDRDSDSLHGTAAGAQEWLLRSEETKLLNRGTGHQTGDRSNQRFEKQTGKEEYFGAPLYQEIQTKQTHPPE